MLEDDSSGDRSSHGSVAVGLFDAMEEESQVGAELVDKKAFTIRGLFPSKQHSQTQKKKIAKEKDLLIQEWLQMQLCLKKTRSLC